MHIQSEGTNFLTYADFIVTHMHTKIYIYTHTHKLLKSSNKFNQDFSSKKKKFIQDSYES